MALTLTAVSEFKSTPYWLHIKPEWIGKQTPVSTCMGVVCYETGRRHLHRPMHASPLSSLFYSWHGCPVKILSGVGGFELTPLFNLIKEQPLEIPCVPAEASWRYGSATPPSAILSTTSSNTQLEAQIGLDTAGHGITDFLRSLVPRFGSGFL